MRRGYVLLAVLWVLVATSLLVLGTALCAREAVAAARNRIGIDRARWRAEGCLAVARALVDSALNQVSAWSDLRTLRLGERLTACDVQLVPVGTHVNINVAGADQLTRTFMAQGLGAAASDSLAQALQDWRDDDDAARPLGAEREWYLEHRRMPPRNGPFADVRELRRVRGFERTAWPDAVLSVEPGRIALSVAGVAALRSLPALTPEAVDIVLSRRSRGEQLVSFATLADWLPPGARDSLGAGMSDLMARATVVPDAWLLRASAAAAPGTPVVTVELRLVLAGNRAAIVRRRDW